MAIAMTEAERENLFLYFLAVVRAAPKPDRPETPIDDIDQTYRDEGWEMTPGGWR